MGAGEGRLKLPSDESLVSGRAVRSIESRRGDDGSKAGEDGRLVGRRKEGALIEFIIVYSAEFCVGMGVNVPYVEGSRVGSMLSEATASRRRNYPIS